MGSTQLKMDSAKGLVYSTNYVSFGPAYGESGCEEFMYTGKYEDPSGLYYYGARFYDPETGRFITEDPVKGSLLDPQGLNRYVYCRNNPHKYTDPDGEHPLIAAFIFGGIVGGTINTGFYLATQLAIGNQITLKGGASAFASGFISGAVSAVTTPIAGTIVKGLGGSATGLAATGLSYMMQAGGEVGAYIAETAIEGDSIELSEARNRFIIGAVSSAGSDVLLEKVGKTTQGMNTIKQSKYFTPRTRRAYTDALLHPDRSRNAGAIFASVAVETSAYAGIGFAINALYEPMDYIITTPTVYDCYENRRY